MQNNQSNVTENEQQNQPVDSLFDEQTVEETNVLEKTPKDALPTPAKTAGTAYSIAALLPTILSLVASFIFLANGLVDGYTSQEWFIYFSFILPQFCFGVTSFIAMGYQKKPLFKTLKAQRCDKRYYLIAILMQIGLFALAEVNTLFLQFLENFGYVFNDVALPSVEGWGFVGALVVVAVLPAIFEETLFRGVVLSGLKQFGQIGSALLCGALFSLYHQNPPQTIYQFICGTAFAFIAIRSGSILPSILSHFINNAIVLVLYKFNVQTMPMPVYVIYLVLSCACLVASIWWLIVDAKKYPKAKETVKIKGEKGRFFLYASVGIIVCALTWLLVLFMGGAV